MVARGQGWWAGVTGREVGVIIKGNMSYSPCDERTVLYLECGGGHTNLHM